jgi:hypothetical protein
MASVKIIEPVNGSRLILDPETPASFQTFALRAEIVPTVPEIAWYVDGEEFEKVSYPYETRWPLSEGLHTFQARFVNANVASEVVTITVSPY